MAKAKRYSMEQIEVARKLLRALTVKKSGSTKKEVVELLAEDVRKAVQEGHSLKTIQDTLGKSDIPISLARMKAMLGEGGEVCHQDGRGGSGQNNTAPSTKEQSAASNGGNNKAVSL